MNEPESDAAGGGALAASTFSPAALAFARASGVTAMKLPESLVGPGSGSGAAGAAGVAAALATGAAGADGAPSPEMRRNLTFVPPPS